MKANNSNPTVTTYSMQFYTAAGSRAGRVSGLTKDEVDSIYRGVITAVACQRRLLNMSSEPIDCFNNCFPTVWDDETGLRVAGY